jgi:hypothetical protein
VRVSGREQAGEEQVALAVELLELFLGQSHGMSPGVVRGFKVGKQALSTKGSRGPGCRTGKRRPCSSISSRRRASALSPSPAAMASAIASCSSQTDSRWPTLLQHGAHHAAQVAPVQLRALRDQRIAGGVDRVVEGAGRPSIMALTSLAARGLAALADQAGSSRKRACAASRAASASSAPRTW